MRKIQPIFMLFVTAMLFPAGQARADEVADRPVEPPNMKPDTLERIRSGASLLHEGNWPAALSKFDEAKALERTNIEPCLAAAANLVQTADPMLSYLALRYLQSASDVNPDDVRVPLMRATVFTRIDDKSEAIKFYEAARDKLKADKAHSKDDTAAQTQYIIDSIKKGMASAKPAPVAVGERRYEMSGAATVIVATKDNGKVVKVAVFGGHDPDKGKQDGTDDGIIEFDRSNVMPPAAVYRRKEK